MASGGAGSSNTSNTSNTSNVTSDKRTKFFIEKYRNTEGITPLLLETAYTNSPDLSFWTGPICDDVGYSQHGGECWSDTTQQILFFADGLRESTQEYFYKTPFSEIEKALDNLGDISPEQKQKVKVYAKAAQRRFINHYNYLKTKNETFDVCVAKPPILKRQKSIIYGSNTAYSIVNYGAGGNYDIIYSILHPLLKISVNRDFSFRQLFDVPTVKFHTAVGITHKRTNLGSIRLSDTNIGIFFRGLMFPCIINTSDSEPFLFSANEELPGHSFGMYSCDGTQYFYDDNYGLIKTKIPLTEISKLTSILVIKSQINDLVVFIKDDNIILNSTKVDKKINYWLKIIDSDITSIYNPEGNNYVEFNPGGIGELAKIEDAKIYLYILQGASVLSFPSLSNVVKSTRRARRCVRRSSTRKRRHS